MDLMEDTMTIKEILILYAVVGYVGFIFIIIMSKIRNLRRI